MNMFLKGLHNFPHIIERIINKSPTDYYDLKEKTITVIKNQQLLRAIKNSANPALFRQNFQWPPYTPWLNLYNLLNAPRSLNNIPVPIDLSRGHAPLNQWPQNDSCQSRGNTAQLEERQMSRGNMAQLGQNPQTTTPPV